MITDPGVARREYESAATVAVDVETTGLRPGRDSVAVVALASPARPPAVIRTPDGVVPGWVLELLSRPGATVVGHNLAAFDLPFLVHAGLRLNRRTRYVDTLVLEALCLVSGRRDLKKDLASVLRRRLGVEIDKTIDHAQWSARRELSLDQVRYVAQDVAYLHDLADVQTRHASKYGLAGVVEAEVALVPVTATMSARGLPVRRRALLDAVADRVRRVNEVTATLTALGLANPRSSQQVKKFFRDQYGLVLESTDADVMATVAAAGAPYSPVAALVLQARQDLKAEMYDADWVDKYVDPDGRVRTRYWQLGTDTGRYSSSEPNLQQIPRSLRHVVGYEHSGARQIVAVDYSQLEVVIAAALFGDRRLAAAVASQDVHAFTASLMYHVPPDAVTPDQRRAAKAATFTALFAGGVPGVQKSAHALGVALTDAEAESVLVAFFAAYPTAQRVVTSVRRRVWQHRTEGRPYKVAIPHGPVRYLYPDARLSAPVVINTMVQGTAAVGLKRAMRRIWETNPDWLAATLHDEVVCDVGTDEALHVAETCRRVMEDEMTRLVGLPVRTSVKIGPTWSGEPERPVVHVGA